MWDIEPGLRGQLGLAQGRGFGGRDPWGRAWDRGEATSTPTQDLRSKSEMRLQGCLPHHSLLLLPGPWKDSSLSVVTGYLHHRPWNFPGPFVGAGRKINAKMERKLGHSQSRGRGRGKGRMRCLSRLGGGSQAWLTANCARRNESGDPRSALVTHVCDLPQPSFASQQVQMSGGTSTPLSALRSFHWT